MYGTLNYIYRCFLTPAAVASYNHVQELVTDCINFKIQVLFLFWVAARVICS
jgi:hypothetical protein